MDREWSETGEPPNKCKLFELLSLKSLEKDQKTANIMPVIVNWDQNGIDGQIRANNVNLQILDCSKVLLL